MSDMNTWIDTQEDTSLYLSMGDFANLIGRSYSMVSSYYARGHLPRPAAMVGTSPGWTKEQINEWWIGRPGSGNWGTRDEGDERA